jgi:hypothetical protein
MLSPTRPPPLPGYDLHEPSEADAVTSLERVFGAERGSARWAEACAAAGARAGRVHGVPALGRVVQALAAQGGATAAIARSMEIRMRTHARLAARAGAPAGGQG